MQNCYKVAWGAASWYNDVVELNMVLPGNVVPMLETSAL